jgi:hypothetical protein
MASFQEGKPSYLITTDIGQRIDTNITINFEMPDMPEVIHAQNW